ncbi:MAG: hypothetical protein KDE56_09610 [Anaerolineales bacterium]|nr:hypothetical protein [Anaerolineales bacterium]
MSFEWQTEEEYNWDEEPAPAPEKPKRRRPRWLWLLLLIPLLLAGGVWAAYRQVNQRVEVVAERTQEEILASHKLIQTAAVNRDSDLFISFLSGREPEWAFGLEEAVRQGVMLDKPHLGLVWQPRNSDDVLTVQNVSPDLAAAEVVYDHTYLVPVGNGVAETVSLRHTDVYRLGPNKWLLAPPEPEFWGEMLVHHGHILHLTYPERDKEVARRLAVDLDEKLMQACATLGLECADDLAINLLLSTNPETLTAVYEANPTSFNLTDLRLPTPSLVGVPINEAGYQTLLRGYGSQVVAALVGDATGYECCRYVHLYQALLDRELFALGLRPWPLTQSMMAEVAKRPFSLATLDPFWGIDQGTRRVEDVAPIYAMVEFVATRFAETPLAELQTRINRFPNQSAADWLLEAAAGTAMNGRLDTPVELQLALHHYITERGALAETAVPSQQLLALCSNNDRQILYRYDPASGELAQVRTQGEVFARMVALPNDNGVAMVEFAETATARPRTLIWQNGRELPVQNPRMQPYIVEPIGSDQNGRFLLLRQSSNDNAPPYAIMPLDTCLNQGICTSDTLLGRPIWSPNGEQMMSMMPISGGERLNTGLLFIGNGAGGDLVYRAEGGTPFWLDEATIAYSPNGRTINTQPTTGGIPETLFSTLDLIGTLATVDQPSAGAVVIDHLLRVPDEPDLLLVVTADPTGQAGQSFLFSYRLSTREPVLLRVLDTNWRDLERVYSVSPNGRFLAISSSDGRARRLYLYDLLNNALNVLFESSNTPQSPEQLLDWSADGQWLLLARDGYFWLVALDGSGEERPLFVGDGYCGTAVWYTG